MDRREMLSAVLAGSAFMAVYEHDEPQNTKLVDQYIVVRANGGRLGECSVELPNGRNIILLDGDKLTITQPIVVLTGR